MEKFFNTLVELNSLLGGINFIFFKTIFSDHSYLPSDVDILIQNEEEINKARKALLSSGFKEIKEVQPFKFRFSKPGLYQIDLYQKISWGGVSFLDRVEKRIINFKGKDFPVPEKEDDFLIILAHRFFTTKGGHEFWINYLVELLKDLDENKLIEKAEKSGWSDAVKFFLKNKRIEKSNIFLIKKLRFDFRQHNGFLKEVLSYLHWRFNSFLYRISKK